jgi:hypothetical protein
MIFPSAIRGQHTRTQPGKGHETKNESVQIKKWPKLAKGVKTKWLKQTGIK